MVEIDLKVKLFGQPNKKSIFYSFKIGYNYLKRLLNYFLIIVDLSQICLLAVFKSPKHILLWEFVSNRAKLKQSRETKFYKEVHRDKQRFPNDFLKICVW